MGNKLGEYFQTLAKCAVFCDRRFCCLFWKVLPTCFSHSSKLLESYFGRDKRLIFPHQQKVSRGVQGVIQRKSLRT